MANLIYPGNFVAALSGYQSQGVESVPSIGFYQIRGYAKIEGDTKLASLTVPSPDQRVDDKVRPDKEFRIPANASVYGVSVRAINLKSLNNGAIKFVGLKGDDVYGSPSGDMNLSFSATQNNNTEFSPEGKKFEWIGFEVNDMAYLSTERTVSIDIIGDNGETGAAKIDGSVEPLDASKPAYILAEVNYGLASEPPTAEDLRLHIG